MRAANLAESEEDLHRLEVGLRQLKVQYDMFFGGGLKRQPVELRSRVDKIVKRYSDKPMRTHALRFRFTALVGRYNSFCERWGKQVRALEEGGRRHEGMLEQFAIRERLLARATVGDQEPDLHRLHEQYVRAQERAGARATPSYDGFLRAVREKTRKLRERSGCGEIELRVVMKDDEVRLKARPRR